MPEKPATAEPRRRWHQFSLRTLLIGVAITSFPLAWIGWQVKNVSERKAIRARFDKIGATDFYLHDTKPSSLWWSFRRVLGDERMWFILIDPRINAAESAKIKAAFPEADFP
jgi:hypothetical protein